MTPRMQELVHRLIAPRNPASLFSASEMNELHEWILETVDQRNILLRVVNIANSDAHYLRLEWFEQNDMQEVAKVISNIRKHCRNAIDSINNSKCD